MNKAINRSITSLFILSSVLITYYITADIVKTLISNWCMDFYQIFFYLLFGVMLYLPAVVIANLDISYCLKYFLKLKGSRTLKKDLINVAFLSVSLLALIAAIFKQFELTALYFFFYCFFRSLYLVFLFNYNNPD